FLQVVANAFEGEQSLSETFEVEIHLRFFFSDKLSDFGRGKTIAEKSAHESARTAPTDRGDFHTKFLQRLHRADMRVAPHASPRQNKIVTHGANLVLLVPQNKRFRKNPTRLRR